MRAGSNKVNNRMGTSDSKLDELRGRIIRLQAESRLISNQYIDLAGQKELEEKRKLAAERQREDLQIRRRELEGQIADLQARIDMERQGFPELEREHTELRIAVERREQQLKQLEGKEKDRQARQRSTPLPGRGAKFEI